MGAMLHIILKIAYKYFQISKEKMIRKKYAIFIIYLIKFDDGYYFCELIILHICKSGSVYKYFLVLLLL